MEKTLSIAGKQVPFKTSGAFLLRYRSQFGQDPLIVLKKIAGQKKYTNDSLETIYNLIWCLAKAADKTIPDPETWLDQFEAFPVVEIMNELKDLFIHTLKGIVKVKN